MDESLANRTNSNRPTICCDAHHLSECISTHLLIILPPKENSHATLDAIKCTINEGKLLGSSIVKKWGTHSAEDGDVYTMRVNSLLSQLRNLSASTTTVIKNALSFAIIVALPRPRPMLLKATVREKPRDERKLCRIQEGKVRLKIIIAWV